MSSFIGKMRFFEMSKAEKKYICGSGDPTDPNIFKHFLPTLNFFTAFQLQKIFLYEFSTYHFYILINSHVVQAQTLFKIYNSVDSKG